MLKKIDHLGIAVQSIDKARTFYEEVLGLTCDKIEEVESQKVKIAIFSIGDTRIELLEPIGADGPVARFLEKKGEGLHHVAYETEDIYGQLAQAKKSGCQLINTEPVQGADNKLIAFFHPKSTHGVLTELCSTKNVAKDGCLD